MCCLLPIEHKKKVRARRARFRLHARDTISPKTYTNTTTYNPQRNWLGIIYESICATRPRPKNIREYAAHKRRPAQSVIWWAVTIQRTKQIIYLIMARKIIAKFNNTVLNGKYLGGRWWLHGVRWINRRDYGVFYWQINIYLILHMYFFF